MRRATQAAELVTAALIALVKSAIDALLLRRRAAISLQWLSNDRFYVYLLFALTRGAAVGCKAGSASRAWSLLPWRDFLGGVRINWRQPAHGILLSQTRSAAGVVRISFGYYSAGPAAYRLFMPYYAHPAFYVTGLYQKARAMRKRDRDIPIFFAGTVAKTSYSDKFAFPILPRDAIISHLLAKFAAVVSSDPRGRRHHLLIMALDSATAPMNIGEHKLSIAAYLDTMARSRFFICPPGWLMPHSHNLIEAMAVGTIPITNYPSYMRPPLTPGRDCLAFATLAELDDVIAQALAMPESELRRLRQGVISYYDSHLDPASFGRKLAQSLPGISEIVVNDESAR